MGLKGLLIGLPLAPYGLALAVLWPASYYIGRKGWNEVLSGASAGLVAGLLAA